MPTGLFIFRRDLRVEDNHGLISLCKRCDVVYCVFVLDPVQISAKTNKYFAPNAMLFMLDSLKELQAEIHLVVLYGDPVEVLEPIITNKKIDILAFNADYTPYSIARDSKIRDMCTKRSVECSSTDDCVLNPPTAIKPYKVFTPYYDFARKIPIKEVIRASTVVLRKITPLKLSKSVNLSSLIKQVETLVIRSGMMLNLVQRGGRRNGIKCMKNFDATRYKNRDMLTYESSRLSPHLKFGTISCREVHDSYNNKLFRKQLYWRDFYMQIAYHFPTVFGNNFRNVIKWKYDSDLFNKWCRGQTGYAIVDACMTQLNRSGYMHNRGRMIVASFLTKILHIDWRLGERYFATKLTDYDPANNNGGWQWSAGTGVDAQPYFRIFNPYTQQSKFDPDRVYTNRWLSLATLTSSPIVDYDKERVVALTLIKSKGV